MREEFKENLEIMKRVFEKYEKSRGKDRIPAQYGIILLLNKNIKAMLLLIEENIEKTFKTD